MKIYYWGCPRKGSDLNGIQINITLIERRHEVAEIVKFITVLMRTTVRGYLVCIYVGLARFRIHRINESCQINGALYKGA